MRFQIFYFILCLTLLPVPVLADAMHYTTLGAKKGNLTPPDLTVKHLKLGQSAEDKAGETAAKAGEEKTFEQVWERYRALAEGRAGDDTANREPAKPIKPKTISAARPAVSALPKIEPTATNAPEASAPKAQYREKPLARDMNARPTGILDQYEQSKARRSQMKMIRLGVPKDLEGAEAKPAPAAKATPADVEPAAGDEG